MFKAKLNDSSVVKGIFDAVSSIISEVTMKIDENGIGMAAMDLSHICLVSLDLKKEDFDEFETDQEYELGINLEDMVKIIRRSGGKDEITFIHNPKDKKLLIEMKPPEAKKSRQFTLALIDLEGEEINLESLNAMEFPNNCTFPVDYLDEAIKDAEIFSEVLEIIVEDKLIFSSTGNIGEMTYELEKDELQPHDFTEESKGIFALSFLKNILKVKTISDNIEMALKSEAPLKLLFDILNASKIVYFLAPRVEEEDDIYDE